jgi:beta-galactosidase
MNGLTGGPWQVPAPPEAIVKCAAERPDTPLILCEYSHAMGNSSSSGGLKE